MIYIEFYFMRPSDGNGGDAVRFSVLNDGDPGCTVAGRPVVIAHHNLDFDGFSDQAETGSVFDQKPPVPFCRRAGQQRMNRSGQGGFRPLGRCVVNLAVGNQEGTADAVARHAGHRTLDVFEQSRAIDRNLAASVARTRADDAYIHVAHAF